MLIQILTVIFICLSRTACVRYEQTVYLQKRSSSDYLYKYDLPALTDFTYCMWLNTAHGITNLYPISISSTSTDNNHLYAFWNLKTSNPILGHCGSSDCWSYDLPPDLLEVIMFGWHKHCCVYKNGDYASWYIDRDTPGVLMETATGEPEGTIPEGAALLILQEQDAFKGGLNADQVGYGKFSMFNMWDYAMTLEQLNALGCKDEGNVVNMGNLDTMGTLDTISEEFECPDIFATELKKDLDSMMFCRKVEQKLSDVSYATMTASSESDCAKKCAFDFSCHSANFIVVDGVCQLNSVGEDDVSASLQSASGVVHLSSVACH